MSYLNAKRPIWEDTFLLMNGCALRFYLDNSARSRWKGKVTLPYIRTMRNFAPVFRQVQCTAFWQVYIFQFVCGLVEQIGLHYCDIWYIAPVACRNRNLHIARGSALHGDFAFSCEMRHSLDKAQTTCDYAHSGWYIIHVNSMGNNVGVIKSVWRRFGI